MRVTYYYIKSIKILKKPSIPRRQKQKNLFFRVPYPNSKGRTYSEVLVQYIEYNGYLRESTLPFFGHIFGRHLTNNQSSTIINRELKKILVKRFFMRKKYSNIRIQYLYSEYFQCQSYYVSAKGNRKVKFILITKVLVKFYELILKQFSELSS